MKRSILVIAISVLHSSLLVLGLNAQELAEVKGKVVDAATNMPAASCSDLDDKFHVIH